MTNSALNGDLNPDLCNVGAVLNQLSYQANWQLLIMWVDHKPVNVEIDDDNSRIFYVFEMWIGMNEFIMAF